jgi:hypothetical protein
LQRLSLGEDSFAEMADAAQEPHSGWSRSGPGLSSPSEPNRTVRELKPR